MRLRLPGLARDERGTSLIEFGFLAPFLALMTMGIIDLSQGLAERFALQQAIDRGLELVQARPAVAAANSNSVDYGFVRTEVALAADVPVAQVTLTRWLECDGENAGDVGGTCPGGAAAGRYLRVRVTKDYESEFYLGTIPMAATGTLRTQ